jgi:hypothetical protein
VEAKGFLGARSRKRPCSSTSSTQAGPGPRRQIVFVVVIFPPEVIRERGLATQTPRPDRVCLAQRTPAWSTHRRRLLQWQGNETRGRCSYYGVLPKSVPGTPKHTGGSRTQTCHTHEHRSQWRESLATRPGSRWPNRRWKKRPVGRQFTTHNLTGRPTEHGVMTAHRRVPSAQGPNRPEQEGEAAADNQALRAGAQGAYRTRITYRIIAQGAHRITYRITYRIIRSPPRPALQHAPKHVLTKLI